MNQTSIMKHNMEYFFLFILFLYMYLAINSTVFSLTVFRFIMNSLVQEFNILFGMKSSFISDFNWKYVKPCYYNRTVYINNDNTLSLRLIFTIVHFTLSVLLRFPIKHKCICIKTGKAVIIIRFMLVIS